MWKARPALTVLAIETIQRALKGFCVLFCVRVLMLEYLRLGFRYVLNHFSNACGICVVSKRTLLTSKDHGFGGFKPWKSFHRLLLEVECVPNLRLLHILHPCYDVAHLACETTQQLRRVTLMQRKQASQ